MNDPLFNIGKKLFDLYKWGVNTPAKIALPVIILGGLAVAIFIPALPIFIVDFIIQWVEN